MKRDLGEVTVAVDWKDTEGLIDGIASVLEGYGIRLTSHDRGSDDYVVTLTPMADPVPTLDEVEAALSWGLDFED